ncbi:Alpha/Beta hydrolase protein [Aspergillus venezuelensis]
MVLAAKVLALLFYLLAEAVSLGLPSQQTTLSPSPLSSARGDGWYVAEQDDQLCEAGSRHFAGKINVTDGRNIFFWFIESRESPNDHPVVIWLNGGPGASSMPGLFTEVGPCVVNSYSNGTVFHEDSWTNHANILFIDQPAGVGFSEVKDDDALPGSLADALPDFLETLNVFYGDIFPQFISNPLYIAGESYGGQYVPFYTAAIVEAQHENTARALQNVSIDGVILVDAGVSFGYNALGHYELFCTDESKDLRFNETTCEAMGAATVECEKLTNLCESLYDPHICKAAAEYCSENLERYFQEEVEAHRRSPYDLRRDCPVPPICGVGDYDEYGSTPDFLNLESVQKSLGFDHPIFYRGINFDLNTKWDSDDNIYLPTTKHLSYLLNGGSDDVSNLPPNSPIPILVMTGEYDVGINVPGSLLLYDHLPWHGQASFRSVRELKPWYWTNQDGMKREGGLLKATPAHKGLEFITINGAGHMAPGDQRGPVSFIVGEWLRNSGTLVSRHE